MSFTIKLANKYPTVKISCTMQRVDRMVAISCKPDCCLQTRANFLFQVWDNWKPFYNIPILTSLLQQHTQHSFIPWHAGQKHQHISKYLLQYVFGVTGTPATFWPGSFSRTKPITVMDWFQPGTPLDIADTASIQTQKNHFIKIFFFLVLWLHSCILSLQLMLYFITV